MDRRNFFKLVGTASGGALTGACGKQAQELIPLLVPATEIVPGAEEWHPSVCSSCAAGCGTIVRVMQAERKIEADGETVRQPVAAIKKIEGNPLDPVSGGRLCARGQAAVQGLYHPDRLTGPRRRAGARGSGDFELVDWETALSEVAAALAGVDRRRIVYLTSAEMGTGSATAARFLDSIGAPPATTIGVNDFTVERRASQLAFGWDGLPVYEIQDADLRPEYRGRLSGWLGFARLLQPAIRPHAPRPSGHSRQACSRRVPLFTNGLERRPLVARRSRR